MGTKLEELYKKMEDARPWPVCLNCGRCVMIGKCCDKYTPVVDYKEWEKERASRNEAREKIKELEKEIETLKNKKCVHQLVKEYLE